METTPDPEAREWAIQDRVHQLRRWGTRVVHPLTDDGEGPVMGASEACSIQVDDPTGKASRIHARIVRTGGAWRAVDLESRNGIQIDGAYCRDGILKPGTELGLGGAVYIAESEQLIALEGFLGRLLGWARQEDIDLALRTVHLAATHRATLVLFGEYEIVAIAKSLHAHARGQDKPFILCDQRRRESDGSVRSTKNISDVRLALREAVGGSLCLLRNRMPPEAARALEEMRGSRPRVQVIVCGGSYRDPVESVLAAPIVIPSLRQREHELDRIISDYASDAIAELDAGGPAFTAKEREWVRTFSASTLAEIEKGARRVVALRKADSMTAAANRLGMKMVSLDRWLRRRHPEQLGISAGGSLRSWFGRRRSGA